MKKKKLSKQHMKDIGANGGKKTLAKYGLNHFSELAKKKWEKAKKFSTGKQ